MQTHVNRLQTTWPRIHHILHSICSLHFLLQSIISFCHNRELTHTGKMSLNSDTEYLNKKWDTYKERQKLKS